MMNKGGFSFVAMLVINPIVILFYQNCSMSPISHAENSRPPQVITRQVASQEKPVSVKTEAKKTECAEKDSNGECSKIE